MGCCEGSKFTHSLNSYSRLQTGKALGGMFCDGGGGGGGGGGGAGAAGGGDMFMSDLQV